MFRNLTPHDVNVVAEDGTVLLTLPSEGIARASQSAELVGTLDGIEIVKMTYGEPIGLPDHKEGVMLIVSLLTANAAKATGRRVDDLLLTTDPVRDEAGRIIGCRRFAVVEG